MKHTYKILAAGKVDGSFAADRRIDHGLERRGKNDKRHAAHPGGSHESSKIAYDTAAKCHNSVPPDASL